MVKLLRSAVLVLACGTAAAAPYAIDPTHTFVGFDALLFDLSTARGRFDRKEGSLDFDAAAHSGRVEIVIDTTSLNTGVAALDRQLQALLATGQHPSARFVAERFTFDGNKVAAVDGQLTLRGRTQPLVLKATRFDCYFNPLFRRQVCGGDFEATLLRSEWGLDGGAEIGLADRLRLLVQVEAIRQ